MATQVLSLLLVSGTCNLAQGFLGILRGWSDGRAGLILVRKVRTSGTMVLGNAQPRQLEGKRHRNETAPHAG